jgi:hypothetical protein
MMEGSSPIGSEGHLLHLDPQTRRNRFCDGAPDQFIRNYDDFTLSIGSVRSARSIEISRNRRSVSSRGRA